MADPKPITHFRLTDHAKDAMARRQISDDDVGKVLTAPEQTETLRQGRVVYQSQIETGEPSKTYLLRVFVDIDREPPEVVTVYRTSSMAKYWRAQT